MELSDLPFTNIIVKYKYKQFVEMQDFFLNLYSFFILHIISQFHNI